MARVAQSSLPRTPVAGVQESIATVKRGTRPEQLYLSDLQTAIVQSAQFRTEVASQVGVHDVQYVLSLPETVAPLTALILVQQSGTNAPGIYIGTNNRSPALDQQDFAGHITFASDGANGFVFERGTGEAVVHGNELGLPAEIRKVTVDSGGDMYMEVDTDISLPTGPGDISVELSDPNNEDYTYAPTLHQPSGINLVYMQTNQEIRLGPGTVALPVAGRAYTFRGRSQRPYFERAVPQWTRLTVEGHDGQDGAAGQSAWQPTFSLMADGSETDLHVSYANRATSTQPADMDLGNVRGPAGERGPQGFPGPSGQDTPGAGEWLGRTSANKLLLASSSSGGQDVSVWTLSF